MSEKKPYRVRVRMYRQGLGDCFLVSFAGEGGPRHALIDCGTLGAKMTDVKMADVVADIRKETGDHLHLLVATHEHKDHVSGFGTEREAFDAISVERVWAAWTENPKDPDARRITKHKGDLMEAVGLAAREMGARAGAADREEGDTLRAMRAGMEELLGFFDDAIPGGDEPFAAALAKTVHEAMSYVTGKAGKDGVSFLEPGQVLEPEWLPGFRVYVLGPPRSEAALRNLGEHGSAELYHMAAQGTELAAALAFGARRQSFREYRAGLKGEERQEFERRLPFDPRFRVETSNEKECGSRFPGYYAETDAWRRIDAEWLTGASDLALQLDSYTNNTSLVLAVEMIDDGRVLLFAADAQVGNWLSWHDLTFRVKDPAPGTEREVTAADLLRRTVFYKVGHHASHNATVTEKGLEMMERDDLVAMIALDHEVAINKRPHKWEMPAPALYRRLLEKTGGRVLRSDIGWADDEAAEKVIPKAQRDANRAGFDVTADNPLYVELRLA